MSLVDERMSVRLEASRTAALRSARAQSRLTRTNKLRLALYCADVLGFAAAYAAVRIGVGQEHAPGNRLGGGAGTVFFLAALPVWIVLARLSGLYDRDQERPGHSTADDLTGVFNLTTAGVWIVYAGARLSGLAYPGLMHAIVFWAAAIAGVVTLRALARLLTDRLRGQPTVVVGTGRAAHRIARKILRHPEYGLDLVGFVGGSSGGDEVEPLASVEALPEIVSELGVERVIIAESGEKTGHVVRSLYPTGAQVDIALPALGDAVGSRSLLHSLEGLPLLGLPSPKLTTAARLGKRTVDVLGALIGLVATAPLFLAVAVLVRLDSPGPIFFRQLRLGVDRRPFEMLKFRTMRPDAGEDAHRAYVESVIGVDGTSDDGGPFKLDRAEVTRVGRWLRRTSLDELPQLINVLRGDMSLVGPRPCLPYEVELFEPHHFERFLVPAGITGLWQVTARAKSTFGEALEMDVAYARGWTLGLDLRILLRTPFALLRPGATR